MIFEKLANLIASALGVNVSEISMDTLFKEDLGADSLDLFELSMVLEDEFSVEIAPERLNEIASVEDAVRVLRELGVEE